MSQTIDRRSPSALGKAILALAVCLLLSGNAVIIALLARGGRGDREPARLAAEDPAILRLEEAMASLDAKLERALAAAPPAAPREEAVAPASTAAGEAGLLERLGAIEKLLGEMRSAGDELEVARLKEEREERLRAEDGYIAADELLAEKKHALAGSAYLKFLEHHPGHPEARDLMGKARDAFLGAGYAEKAFAIHREMMEKFPAERDKDLMSLAMMEKDSRRLDDAIQHAGEAAELARIEEDKVWRLMYRAWFVQLRDGDAAGLQAYRQVEQLIEQLSMGEKNPGRKVKERIAEVEARLARGR